MDYYKILGLDANASPEDIKKAYRKLASKHHPDKGGDAEMFKKVQQAYDVLGNPDKRRMYDMNGPDFLNTGFQSQPDPGFDNIRDFFNNFRNANNQQPRNPDAVVDVSITLEQAYTGTDVFVDVGFAKEVLQIPPGVRDLAKYRIRGKGPSRRRNSPPGDLIIRVNIVYPKNVTRYQDDIYQEILVDALDLMTGATADINHFSGKVLRIKIPKAAQTGTKIKIPGYGMPNPETNRKGNFYAEVKIIIPVIKDSKHLEMLNIIKEEVKHEQ